MYQGLSDLSATELKKGIETLCKVHEDIYPNTNLLAKIRKYAKGIHEHETAGEAWGQVLYFSRRGGGKLSNQIAKKTVMSMGGWYEIGYSQNIELTRSHFLKIYEQILEKETLRLLSSTN